jgi:uncharacterized protein involved in exopolysaccharide biosynthesis
VDVRWYKSVFEISYRDVNPSRAANVVNTLADLYIQENSRYRAARAQETTRALEELATRVRGELESQERRIAEFKAAHLYETADRQQANLQMLNSRQKDLESKEADLASARDAVRMLEEMQAQPSALSGAPSTAAGRTTGGAKVAALERELKNLKLRYSDEHPQVKAKQRELDEARAAASKEAEALASAAPAEEVPSVDAAFQAQRSAMESEVRDLEADVRRIKADIAMYEKRIEDTPRIEQQLGELTKGYDVLLGQYRDYQAKVQSAKGSQEMEQARMGEQFEVIERALPPVLPVWPKPMIILGLGIAAGLAVFVGPVVLRAFARPAIGSEAGLRSLSPEIPVLVTVPRMLLPDTVVENRRRKLINFGLSTASVVVLAAALLALR